MDLKEAVDIARNYEKDPWEGYLPGEAAVILRDFAQRQARRMCSCYSCSKSDISDEARAAGLLEG